MLTPKQLLVIMYQFRGTNAKKNVKKTYNDYAEKHKKDKVSNNSAWCSETIAASFIKAGALGLIGGLARQSDTFVKHFKAIGIWKAGHDRTPKVGDILIRGKNNDPYHSEVVFSVDEKKAHLRLFREIILVMLVLEPETYTTNLLMDMEAPNMMPIKL